MNRSAAVGLFALLVCATVAGGYWLTQRTVLAAPSKVGVLLPEEPVRVSLAQRSEDKVFQQRSTFQIHDTEEVDPESVASRTPGVTVQRVVLTPYYSYKKRTVAPLSMALMLDNSLSMSMDGDRASASDPDYRRLEASRTLLGLLREEDEAALACFPPLGRSREIPTGPIERPVELLVDFGPPERSIDSLARLRNQETYTTPLFRAIRAGIELVERRSVQRKRIVVVLTDGQDTDMVEPRIPEIREALAKHQVALYVVLLGPRADAGTMREVTSNVLVADRDTELKQAFLSIYRQINQSLAGYNVEILLEKKGGEFAPGERVDLEYRAGATLKAGEVLMGES